ncbi:MAG: AAA domain-containing protein [Roseburia hominis]
MRLSGMLSLHKDKSIGVITPFTNQKELINQKLKDNGLDNVTCGTVHAFQGDEKDVVLFSLALTDKTGTGNL